MEPKKLDLESLYLRDAADIVAAREKSRIIHKTTNIDASGDEVEMPVRHFFLRRLPMGYRVSHGHVANSKLETSSQFDVLISAGGPTPILLQTENGTEYVPAESIYAVGEIKSTYYKQKKPVQAFSKAIEHLQDKIAPRGYRDAIFSFMIFVDSNDVDFNKVASIYKKAKAKPNSMPSAVLFMDKGLIIAAKYEVVKKKKEMRGFHFGNPIEDPKWPSWQDGWQLIQWKTKEACYSNGLGFLHFSLCGYLANYRTTPPNLQQYLTAAFIGTPMEFKWLT